MKEKGFNTEIKNTFIDGGHWAYKIPDFPQAMVSGARFNPIKPFDITAIVGGTGVAIESKLLKKYEAFGGRHMRVEQMDALDNVVKAEGRAFVFLNIRQPNPRLNRLIVFDWVLWAEEFKTGPTIKMKELMKLKYFESRYKLFMIDELYRHIRDGVYYQCRG